MIFNKEKLIEGLNKAADIITSSMGPMGNTVIVSRKNQEPLITKDGVSIARSIKLEDPIEDLGAQLLISACNETVKATGDSTTLTALLLQKMVEAVETIDDYNKLYEEAQQLKEYITNETTTVTSTEEIYNIAKTSSNDEYTASLLKEIYEQTSLNVNIEIELTEEKQTTISVDKGYKFDNGFDYAWQITNKFKQEVEYDDPTFYIQKQPLHLVTERIKNLVRLAIENDQALVLVAEKYSREFMSFIQRQVIRANAKILTLKLPSWGEGRDNEILNLKAYLSKDQTAIKVKSTPYYTLITNDDQPHLPKRLAQLQSLSSSVEDPIEANQYQRYYDQLSGNIATIWVGGNTKEETKELYDRIEDAVGATRTAAKYGYVVGMGKTFVNFINSKWDNKGNIVKPKFEEVFRSPFNKILSSSEDLVELSLRKEEGYNLKTGYVINLLDSGIIDPSHSLITAIDNALANTKLILNTKYILHNEL